MTVLNLKKLREDAGRTQADVAKVLGIDPSRVSRYEEDPDSVPSGLLMSWVGFLGANIQVAAHQVLLPGPEGLDPGTPYTSLRARLQLLADYATTGPRDVAERSRENFATPSLDEIKRLAELLGRKPNLVLTGRSDAGKSRIANVLLGRDVLPHSFGPLTRIPTYVRHVEDRPRWLKEREQVLIFRKGFDPLRWDDEAHCRGPAPSDSGKELLITSGPLALIGSYAKHHDEDSAEAPADLEDAQAAMFFVDAPILKACNLFDMPGYTGADAAGEGAVDEDGQKAESAIPYMDILIYVAPTNGFLNGNDQQYLSRLLRGLPAIESDTDGQLAQWVAHFSKGGTPDALPPFANFFVVASHAHPAITDQQLQEQILSGGAKRFYRQFRDTLLADRAGRAVRLEDVRSRFFSFWAETPARRADLEAALHRALSVHVPAARARSANGEVRSLKQRARGRVIEVMESYQRDLDNFEQAREELEKLLRDEPNRQERVKAAERALLAKLAGYAAENLKSVDDLSRRMLGDVEAMTQFIREEFGDAPNGKELAKEYAMARRMEQVQHELGKSTQAYAELFAKDVNQFLSQQYDAFRWEKGGTGTPVDIPFDSKAAFFGGVAGVGFVGALGVWAATLGNLGGYIIAAKVVGLLASLGISIPGGTAAVMAMVAAVGGPVTLAVAGAVLTALGVWRMLSDSWERRLAKKLVEAMEKQNVAAKLHASVRTFWDETQRGFQAGAKATEAKFREQLEAKQRLLSDEATSRDVLRQKLKELEGLRDFFGGIPWAPV